MAHAQLFHGAEGSANLALALAYATYINCEDKQADDSCGRCASCVKMRKQIHPDFYHIFPVASSKKVKEAGSDAFMPFWRKFLAENPYQTLPDWLDFIGAENKQGNISAEEARNVMKKITLKAFEAEYKIMILWQPELLHAVAANALLKTLEEPPAKTVFLLVCNDANKLLTTILSRTQRIAIPTFKDEEIIQYLVDKQGVELKKAKQVAYLSEGNLAKAIHLSGEHDNDRHTWFAEWMRQCYKPDLIGLVRRADEFDGLSKENQKGMFDYALNLFRDLFLFQNGAESLVRLADEELDFVQKFSKAVKAAAVEFITQELSQSHYHLERNARAKMVFLDLSLTMARTFKK